jgi:hypothetical protein
MTSNLSQNGGNELLDLKGENAYPFIGMSWIVFRNHSQPITGSYSAVNCSLAAELLRYYRWINRSPRAVAKLKALATMPIPMATYTNISNSLLRSQLMCTNESGPGLAARPALVWDVMLAAIAAEEPTDFLKIFSFYFFLPLLFLSIFVKMSQRILAAFILSQKVKQGKYRVRPQAITFIETSKERYSAMIGMRPFLDGKLDKSFITGEYGVGVVLLRPFDMQFNKAALRLRQELIHLQEWKKHPNLVKFIGVTEVQRTSYIVSELSKCLTNEPSK